MTLLEIREKIDSIDSNILDLIIKRLDLSKEVAKIKYEQSLPIFNREREEQILNNISKNSKRHKKQTLMIFKNIMSNSRDVQYEVINKKSTTNKSLKGITSSKTNNTNTKVACQGIEGSFSQDAARALFKGCSPTFFNEFEDVFEAVKNGTQDFGVLPIENSCVGPVYQIYDLMIKYKLFISHEVNMKIPHCLATKPGANIEDIKEVYSHPLALAQCSKFIKSNNLITNVCSNTAAAAKLVSQKNDKAISAICSINACKNNNLNLIKSNIQNSSNNSTRFIVISRNLYIDDNADKISLCFSLPHSPGSLQTVLSRFSCIGLNLTKIESRAIANKNFEYIFYLDFFGSTRTLEVYKLLESLSAELEEFIFLGNYQEKII